MKVYKIFAAALLALAVTLPSSVWAQEANSFTPPKAGDFSFGIDATPIINFLGNTLNGTSGQTLDDLGGESIDTSTSTITPDVSIVGRYMLTSKTAVRVNLGLTFERDYKTGYTIDDLALANNPLSEAEVVDSRTTLKSGASLAVGLEQRIGKGRIQGVFSINALYAYSATSTSYSYGNAITSINQSPNNAGLGASYIPSVSYISGMRALSESGAQTHTAGLMGTAGVEWFVATGISIGLEVDLVAAYAYTTQSYGEYEGYSANQNSVVTYTNTAAPASNKFFMATGNYGSNLTLNFYF